MGVLAVFSERIKASEGGNDMDDWLTNQIHIGNENTPDHHYFIGRLRVGLITVLSKILVGSIHDIIIACNIAYACNNIPYNLGLGYFILIIK